MPISRNHSSPFKNHLECFRLLIIKLEACGEIQANKTLNTAKLINFIYSIQSNILKIHSNIPTTTNKQNKQWKISYFNMRLQIFSVI